VKIKKHLKLNHLAIFVWEQFLVSKSKGQKQQSSPSLAKRSAMATAAGAWNAKIMAPDSIRSFVLDVETWCRFGGHMMDK